MLKIHSILSSTFILRRFRKSFQEFYSTSSYLPVLKYPRHLFQEASTLSRICTRSCKTIVEVDPWYSNIYCYGPLLHTVQMAGLFNDSKTFVDMKLKYPPTEVLNNFDSFMRKHQQKPAKKDILSFVEGNFDGAGSEFETWYPDDWHANPAFLNNISDPRLRTWASKIHSYWKELGRKIKEDVKNRPELYSMIYTSQPVIVPGGRFREFFYWDSYWIMKGLLLSEMHTTVRGMLENFIEMVNLLGYVPNGGRVYFRRSQPPLLIPMMKLYLDHTNDIDFIRKNLPALEKEFDFWMRNRNLTVEHNGKNYRVIRYNVEYTGPRPESYREDYELAETLNTEAEKDELYFNLKSGAESGWDFSSRWFLNPTNVKGNLGHTKVRDIIPVELNAFIQLNAKLLADFYRMTGSPSKSAKYDNLANEWRTTINELFWDEEFGCWFDFEILNKTLRREFFPSNLAPLWTGAYKSSDVVNRVLEYLRNSGALDFPGGIPTSMNQAGEQWDFPNGWAPLQHLVVDALDNSGNAEAKALAFEISEKWIASNYKAFEQSKKMFEKYDVTYVGLPGGGGEYEVVVGFGWTNGVALDFLNRYGDKIIAPVEEQANVANKRPTYVSNSIVFGSVSVLLASILGISQVGRCKESCAALKPNNSAGYEYEALPVAEELQILEDIFPQAEIIEGS